MFANDWLRDVLMTGSEPEHNGRAGVPPLDGQAWLQDALFGLGGHAVTNLLRKIRDFEGTKLVISYTDRTPIEKVVKLSLWLADLVILVSAPLWFFCSFPNSTQYLEFNF
jgi:hypothetical protein